MLVSAAGDLGAERLCSWRRLGLDKSSVLELGGGSGEERKPCLQTSQEEEMSCAEGRLMVS